MPARIPRAAPRKTTVDAAIALLKKRATKATRDGMARYGLPSDKAFGVPVAAIKAIAKTIGRDRDLADALWTSGWYEARMLAAYVDDPALVTPAQMDRWCGDFDNWGICDTVCFVLFDRSPHAWGKVEEWAERDEEFVKRTAFVLLACLALHDKQTPDARFARYLPLVERGAADDRNFVKKGVSWALRSIGRRSPGLKTRSLSVARRLAASADRAPRWVGHDAVRDLTKSG